MEDYYKILNIDTNSSQEDIKKAYRKLQLLYHPDKNNNSVESNDMTQKINEAYSVLSDINKRSEYDLRNNNSFHETFARDIFEEFFGGSGNMGPFGGVFNLSGNNPHNIRIFHNGNQVNIGEKFNRPVSIVKNVEINMIQVLEGCIIPVEIERWIMENTIKIFEKEVLYVNIQKGIDNGEIIILKNKGNIINDNLKGDVKIVISIKNTSDFIRNGLDLIYNKKLSLKDALCGFSFDLEYINGKIYTLNNNTGNIITPNYQKTISELGLERENYKGNLIIIFDVEFPKSLSENSIKVIKEVL